ncbi:MAG: dephospho-CoA kinase [Candidatus Hydrogenedentes bacterium]|nr:dephospho-CoA kinase [Candidatus Hydrogenedentota bacterium]
MLKVGLTGGIGSGKTEVAKILQIHGFPVINSDQIGHEFLNIPEVSETIIREFGKDILTGDDIDRSKLGKIVFSDPVKRVKLNEIIHPIVIEEIKRSVEEKIEKGEKVVIIESALIFEDIDTFFPQWLDKLILVLAPEELRIKRLLKDRKLSEEDILARIKSQKKPEDKIPYANWIIFNDDDFVKLNREVERVIKELRSAIR